MVDIDVHHGNGTQDGFHDNPDLFYASTHQCNYFPFSGARKEVGVSKNIVNVPLYAGCKSKKWREAYRKIIIPALREFKPQMLFISAGFDAHLDDPLAEFKLGHADFYWVTKQLLAVAEEVCDGKVVSALEGGYDLLALSESARWHVHALVEHGHELASTGVDTRLAELMREMQLLELGES